MAKILYCVLAYNHEKINDIKFRFLPNKLSTWNKRNKKKLLENWELKLNIRRKLLTWRLIAFIIKNNKFFWFMLLCAFHLPHSILFLFQLSFFLFFYLISCRTIKKINLPCNFCSIFKEKEGSKVFIVPSFNSCFSNSMNYYTNKSIVN